MITSMLPPSPLTTLRSIELLPEHEPLLQAFFVANPAYFLAVQGAPATPDEAHEEIQGELPPGCTYSKKWVIGYLGEDGQLVAMSNVVSDLFVTGIWTIGTFMLATARHGSGDAQTLYQTLETWAAKNSAQWLRLGVVQGNTRAERFWTQQGYIETRKREGYQIGQQSNTLRVMFKPLCGGTQDEYLSLMTRDRPEIA